MTLLVTISHFVYTWVMKKLIIFFILTVIATITMRQLPNIDNIWYLYFLVSSLTYLLGIILLFRVVHLIFIKLDLIGSDWNNLLTIFKKYWTKSGVYLSDIDFLKRVSFMDYTRYLIELNNLRKPSVWERLKASVLFWIFTLIIIQLAAWFVYTFKDLIF